MADIITLRPALLTYRNRVVLDNVVLFLAVQYRARTNDWFLSVLDAQEEPILEGIRVVTSYPLLSGVRDERLPPGQLIAIRQSENEDIPRAGELGDEVLLYYIREEDVEEARLDAGTSGEDLISPAAIRGVV